MTERRSWDGLQMTTPGAYERLLGSSCCPPAGEMLFAVTAEFRRFDAARVSFRLDELARSLFGVSAAREPRAAS
jgi:hypothetical protein